MEWFSTPEEAQRAFLELLSRKERSYQSSYDSVYHDQRAEWGYEYWSDIKHAAVGCRGGIKILEEDAPRPEETTPRYVQRILATLHERHSTDALQEVTELLVELGKKHLRGIQDPEELARVARDEVPCAVHDAAIERLDQPDLLMDVARNAAHEDAMRTALRRLGPAEGWRLVRSDPDPRVRGAALKYLYYSDEIEGPEGQKVLREIIAEDPDTAVCRDAVGYLREQPLLVDVARGDPRPQVRVVAVAKVTSDEALLARIADEDPDEGVRSRAARLIQSQTLLVELATRADPRLGSEIVDRLRESADLYAVATTAANREVRRVAWKKMPLRKQLWFTARTSIRRLGAWLRLPRFRTARSRPPDSSLAVPPVRTDTDAGATAAIMEDEDRGGNSGASVPDPDPQSESAS